MDIRPHPYTVKKALKRGSGTDTFFVSLYAFSPYAACSHACEYCDGRAEKYFIEGDFGKDIRVRENIASMLDNELRKLREPGYIHICSGVSDAYQHLESDLLLTASCAEVLKNYHIPVSVLTKSSMIQRDLPLWKEIHEKSGFFLMISLVYADDSLRKKFEPLCSSVEARLETIKKFTDAGIPAGIFAMPFIPYAGDSDEQFTALIKKAKEAGSQFFVPGALTLRPGRQKDNFMNIIDRYFPEHRAQYTALFGENRQSGAPRQSYCIDLYKRINRIIIENKISPCIPHRLYKGKIPLYSEAFVLMSHLIALYSIRGVDTARAKKSLQLYAEWMHKKRKEISKKRSRSYLEIDIEIKHMFEEHSFGQLIQNQKLADFLNNALNTDSVFDPVYLKIS